MSSQQVPSSLRNIFADTLEISSDEVTPDLSADSVETWDSFRHLQLILSIEDEYGVQFDPQKIPELITVAKVQEALEQRGATL
jgi:acyl carrier protein